MTARLTDLPAREDLPGLQAAHGLDVSLRSSFGSDLIVDFGVSFREDERRTGAEYNFDRVDFAKVLEE
jgi:hypothetical protein